MTERDIVGQLRAALENAEQFVDLYINGCSSIDDAKHTLSHIRSALVIAGTEEEARLIAAAPAVIRSAIIWERTAVIRSAIIWERTAVIRSAIIWERTVRR